MKFNFTFLGQCIMRYETPLDIFSTINSIYEQRFNQLYPANKQLVGKIKMNILYFIMEKMNLK
jgi:hypothetical protein